MINTSQILCRIINLMVISLVPSNPLKLHGLDLHNPHVSQSSGLLNCYYNDPLNSVCLFLNIVLQFMAAHSSYKKISNAEVTYDMVHQNNGPISPYQFFKIRITFPVVIKYWIKAIEERHHLLWVLEKIFSSRTYLEAIRLFKHICNCDISSMLNSFFSFDTQFRDDKCN